MGAKQPLQDVGQVKAAAGIDEGVGPAEKTGQAAGERAQKPSAQSGEIGTDQRLGIVSSQVARVDEQAKEHSAGHGSQERGAAHAHEKCCAGGPMEEMLDA